MEYRKRVLYVEAGYQYGGVQGYTILVALKGYTICLYDELKEITDMSCGLHYVGGVTLAHNQDRYEMLLHHV